MRTFGTFLAAAILVCAAGCGGGSGNKGTSSTGRSGATGGQCPASSNGQTCTGEKAYNDCLTQACGTQSKACFGNNYASGDFTGGTCADWMACEMKCPCDSTKTTCEGTCTSQYLVDLTTGAPTACGTCVTTLYACVNAATAPLGACTQPVCTTTATNTSTSTATGTNCAALQACCAAMTGTLATACQSAVTSAAGDDATCALVVQGFQQQGYCM